MTSRSKLLALNGKPLLAEAWDSSTRVNVRTNRVNTRKQKEHQAYDIDPKKGPFVWATKSDYQDFLELNQARPDSEEKNTPRAKVTPKAKKKEEEDVVVTPKARAAAKAKKEEEEEEENIVVTPKTRTTAKKEIKNGAKKEAVCIKGTAGTILHMPDHKDPRRLSKDALAMLCAFHITGLKGWGVVSEVIDGDTLDLVTYVPLEELALGHTYRKGVRSFIHTSHTAGGFFAKFRCRLAGIDTMEKDTPEGVFAKEATRAYYASFNNEVWYEFKSGKNIEEKEKYGRTLVELYRDSSKEEHLNRYLYQFNKPSHKLVVVYDYDGGAKSEHAKQLNQRNSRDTEIMSRKLNKQLEALLATL